MIEAYPNEFQKAVDSATAELRAERDTAHTFVENLQRDCAELRAENEALKLDCEDLERIRCTLIEHRDTALQCADVSKEELDKSEAAAAQMREALEPFEMMAQKFDTAPYCRDYLDTMLLREGSVMQFHNWLTLGDCRKAKAALATDAGRGWVPLEDVRPLLQYLNVPESRAFLAKHGDKLK